MERSLTWRACQGICRIWTTSMFDLRTFGEHNVPSYGGALLVSNHQSYLDPIVVAVHLYRPVSFMARSTLFEHPLFGRLIRKLHAFPVERKSADTSAIKECVRQLSAGTLLNVYPEGTRSETGEIRSMKKGVTLIIRRAQVPVVPVAIQGSFQAWPKGKKLFHPHPIRVIYGKPMELHKLGANEILTAIDTSWRNLLAQLQSRMI
jgi:1-acyl-sn-glycerol-3-phosphate acyltransferase